MKQRRVSRFGRILRWTGGAVVAAVAVSVLLDATPLLRIRTVQVSGTDPSLAYTLDHEVRADAGVRYFGRSFGYATLLHVDEEGLANSIAAAHPELSSVSVARDWPHTVVVTVTERTPVGLWCRPPEPMCRLWDRFGVRWGQAVESVGPLLVLVIDQRHDDDLPGPLLAGMLAALDGMPDLGIPVRRVILPDAEPGGIRLETPEGVTLALDALGDLPDQLTTLAVFLADRGTEALPAVVDLRTPGRVYFR